MTRKDYFHNLVQFKIIITNNSGSCYLTIFCFVWKGFVYIITCVLLFSFSNTIFTYKKNCYLTVNFNGRKKKTKEGFCSITYFFEPFCKKKKKNTVLKLLRKIAFLWNSSLQETSFMENFCKILELVFSTNEF
jgi:hypothetical protein